MARRIAIPLFVLFLTAGAPQGCRRPHGSGGPQGASQDASRRGLDAGRDTSAGTGARRGTKDGYDCRRFCERLEHCSKEAARVLVERLAGPGLKLSRSTLTSITGPVADDLDRESTCARYCGPEADLFPRKGQVRLVLCGFRESCSKFAQCLGDTFVDVLFGRRAGGGRVTAAAGQAEAPSSAGQAEAPSSAGQAPRPRTGPRPGRPANHRAECAHTCRMVQRCARSIARIVVERSGQTMLLEHAIRDRVEMIRRQLPVRTCTRACIRSVGTGRRRSKANLFLRCGRYTSCRAFARCFVNLPH